LQLEQRVVLLADLQFTNAIRDLLSDEAIEPDQAPDTRTKPFATKSVLAGTSLVHGRLAGAPDVAESTTGAPRAGETDCAPDGDETCAKGGLTRFAQRAFRRPMDATELDELWSVYFVGKETRYERRISLAVEAVLAPPSFSYAPSSATPPSATR
jgi:hypothetical protein